MEEGSGGDHCGETGVGVILMKITLTIEHGREGTNLGFNKEGEPKNNEERIMFEVILESLNLAISRLSEASHGVSCIYPDGRQIGSHN